MTTFAIESVKAGERGPERYRRDPRVKRYLLSKRPPELDRLIGYRTECCVACNEAQDDGAPADVQAFLRGEYEWAVAELARRSPSVLRSLGYPRRYWRHIDNGQVDLLAEVPA